MPLNRAKKQKIIEDLKEKINKQKVMIFVDFTGLKVKDFSDLRKKLKTVNAQLKVAKKTLTQLALKKSKLEIDIKKLKGEIALVFGFTDEITPSKIIWQFTETNPNLKILGGILENKFIETEKIIELAKLPSREELLGKLVRNLLAPLSNFVNVLGGNIKTLIYLLSQIKTNLK